MPNRQFFRSRRVVVDQAIVPASVVVEDGVVAALGGHDEPPSLSEVVDFGDLVLMPGLVDTHVHCNEPGRTEWEGFATATRAAAAGGITTIVDMPLNSVPATTSVEAFRAKLAAAEGQLTVDVSFWGGVVPGNAAELRPLGEAGVLGFKCFLVPSGVDEFPGVGEADLRAALPELAALGVPLLAHAEVPGPIEAATAQLVGASPRRYATWLASRPPAAEIEAIELLLRLAHDHGARLHVVHLSASGAVEMLRAAKASGMQVSVETCPHYLALCAEEIAAGRTDFKCAPPIRERANNEALWAALEEGIIDLVASDHSPCPPAMKLLPSAGDPAHESGADGEGDFFRAWGGIASLELALPVVWTAARERGHGPERIAQWMAAAPARLAGLDSRKGSLAVGRDADFVVWDPEAAFTVDPARLHQRHKLTPYAGRTLRGVVHATYLRGRMVFAAGQFPPPPTGRALLGGARGLAS
ncbi:MAG TPA: allantoinase AllB [Thermoanaerobaculia bacterium]|jgi:allantoinase|nr:allantoinase AllB [Thermoanaerobaculia bacterium]